MEIILIKMPRGNCKGICYRFQAKPEKEHQRRYDPDRHIGYCGVCVLFTKSDERNRCHCCSHIIRFRPRSSRRKSSIKWNEKIRLQRLEESRQLQELGNTPLTIAM